MILHNEYQQGSLEWMVARAGIPTASEFDQLVTPEWKIRTGQMPQTYLSRKLAEAWLGGPLAGFNVWDMDQGQLLEQEARPFYTIETNEEVQPVGFITTDDGRIGCSPDGLIGEDCGLEIKCPAPQTHVCYLLNGTLPKEYAAQVHGSMFVTGRPRWKFMSYRRRFPPLIIEVERCEKIQAVLRDVLDEFLADFEDAMAVLIERNGGPPHRPKSQESQITPKPMEDIYA